MQICSSWWTRSFRMNKFIVFEGPDGSGKSTILAMVKEYMDKKNLGTLVTREPGGTPAGEAIRNLVLEAKLEVSPMTEALLMASSRAQLIDEFIKPSLKTSHILCDRFVQSSLVYQGLGRGLGLDLIKDLNDLAIRDIRPDISFYFSISFEESQKRKDFRGSTDKIENEDNEFHRKIHNGYEMVYNKYKDYYNMVKIDAGQGIDEVFQSVIRVLEQGGVI